MYGRTSLWLLATAGVLVGHVVGYAVAHPTETERATALAGHAYLGPLGTVLIPLGLLTILGVAIRTVRRVGGPPPLRTLARLQVGLFLFQEIGERALGPVPPLDALSEPGVWFGVVAQVLVAWVALRLVHATAAVVRAVAAGTRPRISTSAPRLSSLVFDAVAPCAPTTVRLPARRGPPRVIGAPVTT